VHFDKFRASFCQQMHSLLKHKMLHLLLLLLHQAEVTEDQRSYMVQQNMLRKTTQTQLYQHQNEPTTTTGYTTSTFYNLVTSCIFNQ
jgi:hypothetical protein